MRRAGLIIVAGAAAVLAVGLAVSQLVDGSNTSAPAGPAEIEANTLSEAPAGEAADLAPLPRALSPTVEGNEGPGDGAAPPSPVVQSAEDAWAQDIALAAASRGWTIEEAAADYRAGEIVDRIAGQVAAERPDIFVGAALSPEPGGAPALYIKGPADQFVRSLVANAEIDITIIDNQPFSFEELGERMLQVHRALEAQGFRNVSTGFSVTGGGQITAGVTRQPGLPDDPAEILSGLPAGLRASVTLTVSDAPVAVAESAFGGM